MRQCVEYRELQGDRSGAMLLMQDRYNLRRFVDAQAAVFEQARQELAAGQKRSYLCGLVFPQMRGLGHSSTAEYFAISCLEEARAYFEHPVLGPRLVSCCQIVNALEGRSAEEIFGYSDWVKFRSSVTLFARAVEGNPGVSGGAAEGTLAEKLTC